jgi:hypothetical protein
MERPPDPQEPTEAKDDELVDRVRSELDGAEGSGDETRLETLEKLRGELESELDSSLENDTSGH